MSAIVRFEHSLALPFFGIGVKTDLFQSCGHCWVFQICWHIVPCPVLTCFLTCIQISQEAGKEIWYSHLFENFPQFVVIHTVKGFGIVNQAEVDVFLELSCFYYDPTDVGMTPEINSYHGQLIFNKGYKIIQWGKEEVLQLMMLGQLHSHMQKKQVGPVPHTIHKN